MKQRMKIRNPLAVAIRPENQVSSQAVVRGQTQAPPHTLPTSKYSVWKMEFLAFIFHFSAERGTNLTKLNLHWRSPDVAYFSLSVTAAEK